MRTEEEEQELCELLGGACEHLKAEKLRKARAALEETQKGFAKESVEKVRARKARP